MLDIIVQPAKYLICVSSWKVGEPYANGFNNFLFFI